MALTRVQELAATAGRRACIAWLQRRVAADDRRTCGQAAFDGWRAYSNVDDPQADLGPLVKNAYLAAWRTTWETA